MPINDRGGRRDTTVAPGPVLIGISIPTEPVASWRLWSRQAHLLTVGYTAHVRRAGAVPLLLPVGGTTAEAEAVVARLDAVIISGGADIDPALYGQEAHPSAGPFDPERDDWERALVTAALEHSLPVLGICRGMQLVNAVLGGTLTQHLPDVTGTRVHSPAVGEFLRHAVVTAPGSWVEEAVGRRADVPTYHHQAVDVLAPGLRASAWSDDGTLEAFEDAYARILGVQWHPEEADEANGLFEHFVRTCSPAAPVAVGR
jgi:putative glutamine amidotransferase